MDQQSITLIQLSFWMTEKREGEPDENILISTGDPDVIAKQGRAGAFITSQALEAADGRAPLLRGN